MLVRYIYLESNGSSANVGNHLVEVQAVDADGINRASGKGLLRYSTLSSGSPSVVTDGDTDSNKYVDLGTNVQYAVIDLGAAYDISYIKVWRYYAGGSRYYKDVYVKVSEDDVTYTTVFSSAVDGLYNETSAGKQIDLPAAGEEQVEPKLILSVEAESGILGGSAVVADRANYSKNVVVDSISSSGGSLTLNFTVPYTGEYLVRMYYTHSGNRYFDYTVGSNKYTAIAIGAGYYDISSMDLRVNFTAGTNTVVFTCSNGYAPMFDRFDVYSLQPVEPEPEPEPEPEEPSVEVTKLQYLESTGQQYVNLEITPNPYYTVEVSFQVTQFTTNWDTIFGTRNGSKSRFTARFADSKNGALGIHYSKGGTSSYASAETAGGKQYFAERFYTLKLSQGKAYIDDVLIANLATPSDETAYAFPLFLFANDDGGTPGDFAYIRVAYCKVWNKEELVGHFYSARTTPGGIGLWDEVTRKLFTNSGSGEFAAGPDYVVQDPSSGTLPDSPKPPVDTEGLYSIEEATLIEIADAIRYKTGKTESIEVPDMPEEILSIQSGGTPEEPDQPEPDFPPIEPAVGTAGGMTLSGLLLSPGYVILEGMSLSATIEE